MTGLGWVSIVRLGLVQAAIGATVMLATSLLNRVMVVEYGIAAAVPAALVAWHYAVQLARPLWGHGSDKGRRRTPWIVAGMCILASGGLLAVDAAVLMASQPLLGGALAILAFTAIGIGVGAGGTSLLALLATEVAPQRRAAAAAITWIMMVAGIVVAAATAGSLLDPFSDQRLAFVAGGVAAGALVVALLAVWGVETGVPAVPRDPTARVPNFREALGEVLADRDARRFTGFVFLSMLAYAMQDLILEPFAGLVFAMTPGQSTSLAGVQHGGVLAGMIAAGIGGSAFLGGKPVWLNRMIVIGCAGSAAALGALALAASVGPGWPLAANVFLLGLANGVFAVAAIGSMMALAGEGGGAREGTRMGVWGAAQAIAFALGGLSGAVGVDILRAMLATDAAAFRAVFLIEAALFVAAAMLATRIARAGHSRLREALA